MPRFLLSDAQIRTAGPGEIHSGAGLKLVTKSSVAPTWKLRCTIDGQRTHLGLDSYPTIF